MKEPSAPLAGDTSRQNLIVRTSALSIAVNIITAFLKIAAGVFAASIAIVSEGVNSAMDALTSLLTIVGTKLAEKRPDEKHPFGYGRIEYLTAMVISVIILVSGIEMLKSSVALIIHPEELNISMISLGIVVFSAITKFILGTHIIKVGRSCGSSSLEAVGIESRSDSFVSLVTIISSVLFIVFHISIDAWAGLFTSAMIIRAGAGVLKDTIADVLGRPGQKQLADTLYREIRKTEGVIFAADMMLHNYGPDSYSGSVNIEIDHKKTIGEIYQNLHRLQLHIMHEYKVTMVFGIYAVDNDDPLIHDIRHTIAEFIHKKEHIKSFHALYLDREDNTLYCDFIVDYDLEDYEALRAEFSSYMKVIYPDYTIDLTIETEYV